MNKVILIQKVYRGYICRRKRLPLILYYVQKYLNNNNIIFSDISDDGRINSSIDELKIISILEKQFHNKIKKPQKRMWYDILLLDKIFGWIPVNIKITTMKTSDNVSNLAPCVYAYTDEPLNLEKTYNNGEMSNIIYYKLKHKKYNFSKKDYYFLVINKENKEVVINSVKGLNKLTPNINNLPFQVRWNDNKNYQYKSINEQIKLFIQAIQAPKQSWKEEFLTNFRNLHL